MFSKNNLILWIALIIGVEVMIYWWAAFTATLDRASFFAIEPAFIFDKCARNSGRLSAALNLAILLMSGFYGLNRLHLHPTRCNAFRGLITLFAINHVTHFFYVLRNFHQHAIPLNISENLHGFITFVCIMLVPVILWSVQRLSLPMNIVLVVHLMNVSYFIMETFYNKIKPDKPAYHNQFGIYATSAACLYVLYRVTRVRKPVSAEA